LCQESKEIEADLVFFLKEKKWANFQINNEQENLTKSFHFLRKYFQVKKISKKMAEATSFDDIQTSIPGETHLIELYMFIGKIAEKGYKVIENYEI
jgi:hypothetical protein